MKQLMRILLFFCLTLLAATCAGAGDISVTGPWIREVPPAVRMLAAYMTISNNSKETVQLESAASDDFEFSEFLKLTKCADEIATIAVTKCGTCLVKSIVVKPRKIVKRLIPFRAFDFFFGQRNQSCEMPDITLLQQRV